MCMVEKWKSAKADFLAALEDAKAARKAAEEHILSACGQRAYFYGLLYEAKDSLSMPVWHGECYSRAVSLLGDRESPDPGKHWAATLSAIKAETEFLREWSLPEKWESLWASHEG